MGEQRNGQGKGSSFSPFNIFSLWRREGGEERRGEGTPAYFNVYIDE